MKIKVLNFNKTEQEIASSMSVYQGRNVSINGMIKAVKQGHLSVLESAVIEIELIEIPIFVRDHFVRHRHFNFQCRTLRKKQNEEIKFYIPAEYKKNDFYSEIKDFFTRANTLYQKMINNGITAEKSRILLPMATKTNCIMTGNLRAWIEFIQKRYCRHTQDETRYIAKLIYKALIKLYPSVLPIFDSRCYNGEKLCKKCIREK